MKNSGSCGIPNSIGSRPPSGLRACTLGLVASLNRPGGNITGMSMFASELCAKSFQLLKELIPTATVVAYLVNPTNPSAETYLKGASAGASVPSIDVRVLKASTERDLDEAFTSLAKQNASGLVVPNEPFFDNQRDKIVALAARYAVPASTPFVNTS